MDCIVHGVARSRTRLSDFHFFLKNLKIELLYDSAIPLLSIYLGKTKILIRKDTYIPVFSGAPFTTAKTQEQPKCLLTDKTDEWRRKTWCVCVCVCVCVHIYVNTMGSCYLFAKSCLTLCHGLQPTRLLSPWDFPGRNTGVGCYFLLQGIVPGQTSNLCLLHWQADSLPLSHQASLQWNTTWS